MSTTGNNDMLKNTANLLYQSTLIAAGTAGSRYLTKNFFKDRDLKFDLKSIGVLALDVTISSSVVGVLQDKGIIPKEIMN